MKKFISFCSLLFLILLFSQQSVNAEKLGVFAGIGANYKPGESIRMSYGPYEVGLLADRAIGFIKNFKSGAKYVSFGLATDGGSGGLWSAIGLESEIFWGLHGRAELYAFSYGNGSSRGRGLLGLGLYF